jgi:mannose-6-phosphate isomerase-like protein (cupin superfamily)
MYKWSVICRTAVLSAVIVIFPVLAQEPKPTCQHCSATYIPKSEIDAYAKRAINFLIQDQQIRSVDIGKSQVGIGINTRRKLDSGKVDIVAEHEQISEIFYVIDGSATLLTGSDLVGATKRSASAVTVKEQNGPGFSAKSIKNPVTHHLKVGDVIIIPAGVGHQFTEVPNQITYIMFRVDPDKVVPLKSEAQSLEHLKKPYVKDESNF